MTEPLEGQVAIVTGGAGFIGRAITQSLAKRGVRVVTVDLLDAEVEHAVRMLVCDVTDSASVDRVVARAQKEHDRLDILVNCAGGGARTGLVDLDDETWFFELNKNLTGAFFFMRAALPHLLKSQFGSIVNVSSSSAGTRRKVRSCLCRSESRTDRTDEVGGTRIWGPRCSCQCYRAGPRAHIGSNAWI